MELPPVVSRHLHDGDNYLPFGAAPDKPPPFLPIGGKTLVRQTSSTHGPDGYITTDPEIISLSQARLRDKILGHVDRITLFEEQLQTGAETLVVSYGVTARAVADAAAMLAARGRPVSTLTLKSLWPVPERLLREKAAGYERVVVIEMNLGQYVQEVRRVLGGREVEFFGQMNGVLITPLQIVEVVDNG